MKNTFLKYRISLFLLGLALIIYVYASITYYRYNWYPVSVPINSMNTTISKEFKADLNGRYSIYLQFDYKEKDHYWRCVFGTAGLDHAAICGTIKDSVSVVWKVKANSHLIAEGVADGPGRQYFGGPGSRFEGSHVTYITAEVGRTYQISALVSGPPSIKDVNPYLKVAAPELKHKSVGITHMLLTRLSLIIVLFSLSVATIQVVVRIKRDKTSQVGR